MTLCVTCQKLGEEGMLEKGYLHEIISGPQEGPAERGHVKMDKTCRNDFSTIFKYCQKVSSICFDTLQQDAKEYLNQRGT